MRVDTESAPWFYKLDAEAHAPTDAISADEWDANVPENMAPVLGDFARGALGARRSPSPMAPRSERAQACERPDAHGQLGRRASRIVTNV